MTEARKGREIIMAHSRKSLVRITSSLLLAVVLVAAGCGAPTRITKVPSNVSQRAVESWYLTVGALGVIADATRDTTRLLVTLRREGVIADGPEYVQALDVLGRIAQAGVIAAGALRRAPERFEESVAAQMLGVADDLLAGIEKAGGAGLLRIRDPGAAQKVDLSIQLLRGAARTMRSVAASRTREGGA